MTTERQLWERIKEGWGKQIKLNGGRIERVENAVGAGMPDVNLCFDGTECWVELKTAPGWGKKRPTFRVYRGLEPAQINWHLSQHRAGGKSLLIAQIGKEVFAVDGKEAADFNDYSRDQFNLWRVDVRGDFILYWKEVWSFEMEGKAV